MKLFRKYKAITYLPNPYSLLQYYLLAPYSIEDTLFLFHEEYPLSIVKHVPGGKVLYEKGKKYCYTSLLIVYWHALYNHNIPVYLGGWPFFSNLFLRLFKHIFYLEDGTGSYELVSFSEFQNLNREKVLWRRWIWGNVYPRFGLADNVECIYLTGILPIPDIISKKVQLINLYTLWQQKSPDQKKEILDVFLPQDIDLNLFNDCDTILLTQPFSEYSEGNFAESDKIDVYHQLLAGYDESKVLIKVHPAESTDYSVYFPSAKIIAIPCPMELLALLGIPLCRAITVNSTAIYSLGDSVEKIITGYDVTPTLIKEAKRRNLYDGISNKLKTKQSI